MKANYFLLLPRIWSDIISLTPLQPLVNGTATSFIAGACEGGSETRAPALSAALTAAQLPEILERREARALGCVEVCT